MKHLIALTKFDLAKQYATSKTLWITISILFILLTTGIWYQLHQYAPQDTSNDLAALLICIMFTLLVFILMSMQSFQGYKNTHHRIFFDIFPFSDITLVSSKYLARLIVLSCMAFALKLFIGFVIIMFYHITPHIFSLSFVTYSMSMLALFLLSIIPIISYLIMMSLLSETFSIGTLSLIGIFICMLILERLDVYTFFHIATYILNMFLSCFTNSAIYLLSFATSGFPEAFQETFYTDPTLQSILQDSNVTNNYPAYLIPSLLFFIITLWLKTYSRKY